LENQLRSFYLLELLDTELDELKEQRGDLPEKVNQLEESVGTLKAKIEECDTILKVGESERVRKERETLEYIEKIEKYKGQQLHVHNNKEYDALTHEIEMAESLIETYEADIERFTDEAELIRDRKVNFQSEFETQSEELKEKKKDLTEILQLNAEEENILVKQREIALKDLSADDMEAYSRIRNAKGKAVAPIKRNSCSGCFNVVPPQKILEIKKHNRLYTCEHCGRILVSEEISRQVKIR
jgi:uncharacterized protein